MLKIARVVDGVVVNIEIATQEWLEENQNKQDAALLIPYTEEHPAFVGFGWSEKDGFERPPAFSEEIPNYTDLINSIKTGSQEHE